MAYSTDHKLSRAPTRRRALRDGRYKTLKLTVPRVHSTNNENARLTSAMLPPQRVLRNVRMSEYVDVRSTPPHAVMQGLA